MSFFDKLFGTEQPAQPTQPAATDYDQRFNELAEQVDGMPPEQQAVVKGILELTGEALAENRALAKSIAPAAPVATEEPESLDDDDEAAALAGEGGYDAADVGAPSEGATADTEAGAAVPAAGETTADVPTAVETDEEGDEISKGVFADATPLLQQIAKSLMGIEEHLASSQRTSEQLLESSNRQAQENADLRKSLAEVFDAQEAGEQRRNETMSKALETLTEGMARTPAPPISKGLPNGSLPKLPGSAPGVRELYADDAAVSPTAEPSRYGISDKQLRDGIYKSLENEDDLNKSLAANEGVDASVLTQIAATPINERPVAWYRVAAAGLGITINDTP